MSKENLSPVWARAFDIDVDHGEGIYLYGKDGRRYMDFTCGIGVTNTGHAHPRVVRAIQEQAAKLIHGQIGTVTGDKIIELTDELLSVVPKPIDTFFFSNSGAEAVEASVKLAKQVTGRTNVITFEGSFHGRSHLTMAMTMSKTSYRQKYQPLPAGVFASPYAHCFHCPVAKRTMSEADRGALSASCPNDDGKCCGYAHDAIHFLLKTQSAPQETAAIVIEPVLGEGGYVVPPASFLQELRKTCDEHGIMLIFDEVQTGFGRTGKFFGLEHFGVVPDILVMAKGLASGMPLSCVAARRELMQKWPPGSHGGTYGPNLVSAAAGVETIRVMKDEQLVENSMARGASTDGRPAPFAERFPDHRRCARAGVHDRHRVCGCNRPAEQGDHGPDCEVLRRPRSALADLRVVCQCHPLDSAAGDERAADRRSAEDLCCRARPGGVRFTSEERKEMRTFVFPLFSFLLFISEYVD